MTLVVLTGLLMSQIVSQFAGPALGWRACFWYVTIQSLSSYFLSGSVKLLRPEWRNGSAMTIFLNAAIHGPLSHGHWLLLDTRLAGLFCLIAAVFHFLVFWFFGLNRFFWAWMATFPAILWCAGQI
jgi:hypothetical protein